MFNESGMLPYMVPKVFTENWNEFQENYFIFVKILYEVNLKIFSNISS